uniref:DRBM domain-containing protein n=1 Tax=Knipowitschia caucasica TaxID=637954 RepID=A0AAV2KLX4_KNICA
MLWREKIDVGYKNEICEVLELASQNYLEAKFSDGVREGPIHNAIFNVILTCGEFKGQGKGPTKNAAKLQAAQQILPDLRLLPRDENPNKKRKKKRGPLSKPERPVETLNELKLQVAGETVVARGKNKKDAKRNAAAKMLNIFGYSCSVSEPELEAVEEVAQEIPIQEEVEIQPPVEEMGPVLPIVAATEEIEVKNEVFQLCATSQQPDNQALSVTVEDGADVSENIKPEEDVSSHQEVVDVCSSSETTTEESRICNIVKNHRELGQMNVFEDEQLLQGPETEVEAPEMSSYNVDIAAPIDQEFSPEILLEPALTEEGNDLIINQEATLDENNPQANINYLPDDILSMLAHMGVITENNGTLAWAEATTNEERPTSPVEDQTRDESVSVVANKHKDQGELSPIDPPCPEETSGCTVEEITEATNESSETSFEEKSENLILDEPEEEREVSVLDPPRPEEISIPKDKESLESFEEMFENLIPDRPVDLDKPCQEEDKISIIQESKKSAKKTTTLTIITTMRSNPNPETCIKSFEETCDNLTSDGPGAWIQ